MTFSRVEMSVEYQRALSQIKNVRKACPWPLSVSTPYVKLNLHWKIVLPKLTLFKDLSPTVTPGEFLIKKR